MNIHLDRLRFHLLACLSMIAALLLLGGATARAEICDSNYRVTVWGCQDIPGVFPLKVQADFLPGGSDVNTFGPGNHDVYPAKPTPAATLSGAWVKGVWVPFGSTTNIPLIPGLCLEVRVGTDASGCQHIHIQCIPCPEPLG